MMIGNFDAIITQITHRGETPLIKFKEHKKTFKE